MRQPSGPSVSEVAGQENEVIDYKLYDFAWHVILDQVKCNAHRFRRLISDTSSNKQGVLHEFI